MPNRYIRASAIESESINSLPWQAEVFIRRLWNRVDDFGRFTANPQLLRAAIFPLQLEVVRDADMPRLLLEGEKAGQLYVYSVLGKQYLVVNRWERGRALKSEYPRPPANICERVLTYVGKRWQKLSNVPDSDSDSDSDSDADADAYTYTTRRRMWAAVRIGYEGLEGRGKPLRRPVCRRVERRTFPISGSILLQLGRGIAVYLERR